MIQRKRRSKQRQRARQKERRKQENLLIEQAEFLLAGPGGHGRVLTNLHRRWRLRAAMTRALRLY
jgi:hypothetical protein